MYRRLYDPHTSVKFTKISIRLSYITIQLMRIHIAARGYFYTCGIYVYIYIYTHKIYTHNIYIYIYAFATCDSLKLPSGKRIFYLVRTICDKAWNRYNFDVSGFHSYNYAKGPRIDRREFTVANKCSERFRVSAASKFYPSTKLYRFQYLVCDVRFAGICFLLYTPPCTCLVDLKIMMTLK